MSEGDSGVFIGYSESLERWIQLGIASGNVIQLTVLTDSPGPSDSHPILDRVLAYLDKEDGHTVSEIPIALTVPTQQREIYQTVREIPYGHEWAVSDVVARTAVLEPGEGSIGSVRECLTANPIPILIPDHRVSDSSGSLEPAVRERVRSIEGLA